MTNPDPLSRICAELEGLLEKAALDWKQRFDHAGTLLTAALDRAEKAEARIVELEAQVRTAHGFDRDAVFATLDAKTARIQALEAGLREIRDLKSTPIGDTGFAVGAASLLSRAQEIARNLKVVRASTILNKSGGEG